MTEQQLPTFMGNLVRFQREFMGLPTDVAQWAIQNTALAIEAMYPALCEACQKSQQTVAPVPEPPLLQLVSTIAVPAMTEAGKVSDLFKQDTSESAQVKISRVGDNFKAWFGEMLVSAYSGSTLYYHTLTRSAYDKNIIAVLGGENKCETSPAEIWWLMNQQKNGEAGVLLTNGYANIFYVRDQTKASALRAVVVYCYVSGWLVYAFGLDDYYWGEGRRVFVPSSSVGSSC